MNRHAFHIQPRREQRAWILGLAALTLGSAALNAAAEDEQDWARSLRLGAVSPLRIKGTFSLQGSFTPSGLGASTPGNEVFDDGYLKTDNTGNAQNLTSNWGYQNASQVGGGNILFHRTTSGSTGSGLLSDVSNDISFGLDMAYGGVLKQWKRTLIGWEFGFNYLPIGIRDHQPLGVSLARDTFSYAAPAVVPGAPYNGGPSGVGPLLGTTPVSGTDTVQALLTGTRELDCTLYAFKLGPTLQWELSRQFALQVGLGGAMGLVTGGYRFQEIATASDGAVTQLSGRFSESHLVFGGYAGTTFLWHTGEGADIYVGAQFMRLGSTRYGESGREARLDLSQGVYLSAGFSWPF